MPPRQNTEMEQTIYSYANYLYISSANITNLDQRQIGDGVPDENIGKNLKELYIMRSNLKQLDGERTAANLKKIGYPNILPGQFFYSIFDKQS